ncbi:hypothetical protein BDV96DRAFT_646373 [Lophiotrema nucula]|uniref:Mid2 domain-containing protein n=1 Tax=Lophiotrema nucula TaxID=690887 RepID=A0A6A5ZAE6_9PLEO|nr:hypothetical protein BDV96DRAFT_646373 [Lophiotrema nucula]
MATWTGRGALPVSAATAAAAAAAATEVSPTAISTWGGGAATPISEPSTSASPTVPASSVASISLSNSQLPLASLPLSKNPSPLFTLNVPTTFSSATLITPSIEPVPFTHNKESNTPHSAGSLTTGGIVGISVGTGVGVVIIIIAIICWIIKQKRKNERREALIQKSISMGTLSNKADSEKDTKSEEVEVIEDETSEEIRNAKVNAIRMEYPRHFYKSG